MSKVKILKKFLIFLITMCLLSTLNFLTACREDEYIEDKEHGDEETEEATDEGLGEVAGEGIGEDSVEMAEEEIADEISEKIEEDMEETEEEPAGETVTDVMQIESYSFKNNEMIPPDYTCDGTNVNPTIIISGVPENTGSLALIMEDPDAPGGTWVHWTVWNIGPETERIFEESIPEGAVEGTTDFGKPGYEGPCPPSGTHRYFFRLYALNTMLDINSSATVADILEAMDGHVLDSAELIGLYGRDQ